LGDPDRRFTLSAEDIALVNPNRRTCPIFHTRLDPKLSKAIYRRVPVLVKENKGEEGDPWKFRGLLMSMMNADSDLFLTRKEFTTENTESTQKKSSVSSVRSVVGYLPCRNQDSALVRSPFGDV
jgi:hypothetical protein